MPTSSLAELKSVEEDWTGKDAKTRRKIQNRLNVRAYRRRKMLQALDNAGTIASSAEPKHSSQSGSDRSHTAQQIQGAVIATLRCSIQPTPESPCLPLSLDHLIPLVQYNVARALYTNICILSMQDLFEQDCGHLFLDLPAFPSASSGRLPESLSPTPIQCTVPHNPWLNICPDRQLRDNLIIASAAGIIDINEMELDITGFVCAGILGEVDGAGSAVAGVIVWKDPWRVEGWELTESFVHKWAVVLQGCSDLMRATNYWRQLRGEDPLLVKPLSSSLV
ncbi:hypothetical protein GQ53DRAFT_862786 [Thozetella sp. PMI_491]|nr:hypothetical protein GQ53DRAFT_862786 [Thozetella sp. PMI_491]